MDVTTLLQALAIGEDDDWEFKSARGGIPGSMWETYSGMANTDGGAIALGVEDDGTVSGLVDPAKCRKSFWDTINNRGKVSANLLSESQATIISVEGKDVLVIRVPRAARRQRPVYVGQNPLDGTYRRNFEGDYKCRPDEVGRMLADQSEESLDSRILKGFGVDDLDGATLEQYRNRLSSREPTHPFLTGSLLQFLEKIGAWRRDRSSRQEGLTVAGLLMFGKDEAIRDPEAVPQFNLDYRERLSDDPNVRWTDRLTADGKWVCNVFQFYQKVVLRLAADLKVPFALNAQMVRQEDTVVHQAVREALVNCLVHADYRGQGGVIVEKYRDRFEFSDPGTLLLDVEQILRGGVSECRNRLLQTMFSLLGYGEKAGSGYDKIRQGWSSQNWRSPSIEETARPDRVNVVLPMVSLLPEASLERLQKGFGTKWRGLSAVEVQALVTAEVEGQVTNTRMQQLSIHHPADLTRVLHGLASRGFLRQVGQKRGTAYILPERVVARGSSHTVADSSHKADSLHKPEADSSHSVESLPPEELKRLKVIAAPAAAGMRLPVAETRRMILALCQGHYFTAAELGELLSRNPISLRNRFLSQMVTEGLLERRYPDEPNRPDQAYTAKKAAGAT